MTNGTYLNGFNHYCFLTILSNKPKCLINEYVRDDTEYFYRAANVINNMVYKWASKTGRKNTSVAKYNRNLTNNRFVFASVCLKCMFNLNCVLLHFCILMYLQTFFLSC